MAKYDEQRILDIQVKYDDAIEGIIRFRDEITKLKEANKSLAEQYKQTGDKEFREQIEANNVVIKQYGENVRILQKEVQNNIRQEQENEGSLKSLRAELSNVTRQYDELSRTERNGAKGHELQKHINEITDELKGAEESTERFYRNVGNYKNSIIEAITGNNKFASSLAALAQGGGGIQGMFTNAIGSAKAFGAALFSLMSNPVFLGIAGIAGAGIAFKWFYDYNKGIQEASELTEQFLGVSGNTMKAIRTDIQATADTYGKDYKETLEAVDVLVSQYGVDAQTAIKIINDGFQSGADLNGDMIDKIKQYAPAFHDAGISASELVATIQQTRSGIFSDKGMDIITMASKRIREMSSATASSLDAIGISSKQVQKDLADGTKSTYDVIKEISTKMKDFGADSQEVGEVLKNVFGRQGADAGIKLIEQLDTMNTDLSKLKDTTGEHGEALEKNRQATLEFNRALSALFDMSDKGFGEMIINLKTIAITWITRLIKGIINVINYCIRLYNQSMLFRYLIQALVVDFKMVWNTVKLVCNLIIDAFKSVGNQLLGIGEIIEGIVTLSWDKIKAGFSDLVHGQVKVFKEGVNDLKNYGKSWGNALMDGMKNTINSRANEIKMPEFGDSGSTTPSDSGGRTTNRKGGNKPTTAKSGKNSTKSKSSNATPSAQAIAKVEEEETRKAQDLLNQLITDSYERQRETIITSYDRRIEDIKKKLTTEKNLTVTTVTALNSQVKSLEELKNRDLEKLDNEHKEKAIQAEQAKIANYLTTYKKGTDQSYDLRYKQLENEQRLAEINASKSYTDETERNEQILAIRAAYNEKFKQLDDTYQAEQLQNIKDGFTAKINEAWNDELAQAQLQADEAKAIYDAAYQQQGESTEAFLARKSQLYADWQQKKKDLDDKEVDMEKTKWSTITDMMGSVSDAFDTLGETSKGFAKLSKVIALAQIAINMGQALTSGWATASKVQPYPAMVIAQAQVVASVMAQMASAIKIVKSAKFAHGGLITGAGTGTSDDITIQASNGESMMTAAATSMFAPALSTFNQLGGGVPIITNNASQEIGEEFLANAVARGMANAPRPVVSIEEINRVQSRVKTIEQISEQ